MDINSVVHIEYIIFLDEREIKKDSLKVSGCSSYKAWGHTLQKAGKFIGMDASDVLAPIKEVLQEFK